MTYGLRINFEYYFLQEAQSFIQEANKASSRGIIISKLLDIKLPKSISYKVLEKLYPKLEESKTDHTVKCAMACLMISFGYEAVLNYIYRLSINKTSENAGDLETKNEIREIKYRNKIFIKSCETYKVEPSLFEGELKILEEIYSSRNDVVHYKEAISYQGFSFKNPIESKFSLESTQKGLNTLRIFIEKVQTHFNLNENDLNILKYKHFLNY